MKGIAPGLRILLVGSQYRHITRKRLVSLPALLLYFHRPITDLRFLWFWFRREPSFYHDVEQLAHEALVLRDLSPIQRRLE
jgi:hypothetical protein